TGKPVYIFTPSGGSAKFSRFHSALSATGAVKPLPEGFNALDSWNYSPLDAAESIAAEIERRYSRRSRMLPGFSRPT
ncbi:MAG: mitochondrial fission ELM1 family protein, partial [Alphaproteobacteria bacterium]|nr:mitochondrial fission ELM1 family protein [Alphaproteobacteria bacterium]